MVNRKRNVLVVLGIAVVTLLAAVGLIIYPILTHQSGGASGQAAPSGLVSEVSALGDDGRTRTLTAIDENGNPADLSNLNTGDKLTVKGLGFDASIGIYVGFCKVPEAADDRPTPCLGGIPDDAQAEKSADISDEALESAWITDNWAWRSFASHRFIDAADGSFEVTLQVPQSSGEGLDCETDACGIFTRADHTALKDRVQDVYLPFEFAAE